MAETLFDDPLVSPGASSVLQAPGQSPPGIGMAADTFSAGSAGEASPELMAQIAALPQTDTGGIGLAPELPAGTKPSTVKNMIEGMTPAQKVFAALGEFGAGVTGKHSPLALKAEQQNKDRLLQMAELKENVSALEHGVAVSQKLSGEAKNGFVEDYAAQLDNASPGLGKTFRNLSAQPGLLEDFQKYMPYMSEPLQLLAKLNPTEFVRQAGSEHVIKELEHAREQYLLKSGTRKARLTMGSIVQHPDALIAVGVPQELIAEFTKQPKASTFAAINDALPASTQSKMTDDELLSATENRHFHQALGMLSPADEGEIRKKGAEANITNTPFMKEAAALYGKDSPEYNAAVEKHIARMDSPTKVMVGDKETPEQATRKNAPQAEALYKDYANHPQVKEANALEVKLKPILDYMKDFTKTGKSVNAQDAAIAKAYLAATTSLGNRAYTMDKRELEKLPNLGDRLGNMASSFFSGKDLTDQTRHDMVKVIGDRYRALDAARQEQRNSVIKRGTARNIPQEQIFGAD